jgi:hypothetical protein
MLRQTLAFLVVLFLVACPSPTCPPAPDAAPVPAPEAAAEVAPAVSSGTSVIVKNPGPDAVSVAVAFGSDSQVTGFFFCNPTGALTCSFKLDGKASRELPLAGGYLNATFVFNTSVGCGSTKAEINVNNPQWYNTVDISLVDGFSTPLTLVYKDPSGSHTFSVSGKLGNERAPAVFPLGCDTCVARTKSACGMSPGKDGCKAGTQFAPVPPCQFQGSTMSGRATTVEIVLGAPA